jgi:hypothetical protein
MRGCDHSGGSATLLLAAALIAGCNGHSSPAAVGKAYDADSSVNPALIAADDGFGLKLLAAIVPGTSGNVAIAPVSVANLEDPTSWV